MKDVFQPESRGRDDHLANVRLVIGGLLGVGIQRIRVIAQSRETHFLFRQERLHFNQAVLAEIVDIEVRHPRISPLGFTGRPAAELHTIVVGLRGEADDFFKTQIR
mgnify:CR=1 FL=1